MPINSSNRPPSNSNVWTKEEIESLYWYYVQARRQQGSGGGGNDDDEEDPIGAIIRLYAANDQRTKTRIAVIQQLLLQDIITLTEYDDHMAAEDVSVAASPTSRSTLDASPVARRNSSPTGLAAGCQLSPNTHENSLAIGGSSTPPQIASSGDDESNQASSSTSCTDSGTDHCGGASSPPPPPLSSAQRRRHSSADEVVADDIQVLKQRILNDNKGKSLLWVQKTLIDCCYVKLSLQREQHGGADALANWTRSRGSMEPIPLHYSCEWNDA